MTEVEIKAKVKDFNLAKENLKILRAKHIKTEKLIDRIFGRDKDMDENHCHIEGTFNARIRACDDKMRVELKEIKRAGAGMEVSSPIFNIDDGVRFLQKLDYKEVFTISKIRETYELGDFEICLDEVDKLGKFIEIEHREKDGQNIEKALIECKEFLLQVDSSAEIIKKKYGDLMQEIINKNKNV